MNSNFRRPLGNVIFFPEYLADPGLESAYESVCSVMSVYDHVEWDFSGAQWLELTSLVRLLCMLTGPNIPRKLDIRLPAPSEKPSDASAPCTFLLESGFLASVGDLSNLRGFEASVLLPLPRGGTKALRALNTSIDRYYERHDTESAARHQFKIGSAGKTCSLCARAGVLLDAQHALTFAPYHYSSGVTSVRFSSCGAVLTRE